MADYNISSAMSLPIPTTGVAPGPEWADLLNACLAIIDGHTHSGGTGNQITPNGFNINSNLAFNNNNATLLRSARFSAQGSTLSGATDVGCAYVSGVDLYFNDGAGNKIRITQSGGVAGSPGSIANLTSPASATYSAGSSTFVWQSGANLPANLDAGSIIIRNLTVGSNGITLSAPNALGANYVLTLPSAPPASTKIVTMDATGALGVTYDVDNSTIEIASSVIRIKDGGISTPKYADGSITSNKLAAKTYALSSGCGNYSLNSVYGTTYNAITNLSVSITTTGRPVRLVLVTDTSPSTNPSGFVGYFTCSGSTATPTYQFFRGSTGLGATTSQQAVWFPSGCLTALDVGVVGSPGTYTYSLQTRMSGTGSNSVNFNFLCLLAYEL